MQASSFISCLVREKNDQINIKGKVIYLVGTVNLNLVSGVHIIGEFSRIILTLHNYCFKDKVMTLNFNRRQI